MRISWFLTACATLTGKINCIFIVKSAMQHFKKRCFFNELVKYYKRVNSTPEWNIQPKLCQSTVSFTFTGASPASTLPHFLHVAGTCLSAKVLGCRSSVGGES